MVGSKENYKFDVGVKGLIIYLLGIIVSCLHMFRILHALISLISMWVLIILPGNVMSRTMHYINYLFNYIVINGCDYMFGYKQVEILLENVAEILVVLLIYCWFNYFKYSLVCRVLQLKVDLWSLTLERLNFMLIESSLWFLCWVVTGSLNKTY